MKAKELLRRYQQECKREFQEVDLSGESLQGMNLSGINLSRANLTGANLKSTNLTDATLVGTKFSQARMGVAPLQALPALLFVSLLTVIGVASLYLLVGLSLFIDTVDSGLLAAFSPGHNRLLALLCIAVIAGIILRCSYSTATEKTLIVSFVLVGLFVSIILFFGNELTSRLFAYVAVVILIIGTATALFSICTAVSLISTVLTAFFCILLIQISMVDVSLAARSVAGIIGIAILTFIFVVSLTRQRTLSPNSPDKAMIQKASVWISSIGGTKFNRANLTDADFSFALMAFAHFRDAKLTRTYFGKSYQLHLSRVYKTILDNRIISNLLSRLEPEHGKSYTGLNLKNVNLAGAELDRIVLTETDLSGAILENTHLEAADLRKVQALGTNFCQAHLTGACIESWNIDSTTRLERVDCEYIYLLRDQRERRPSSGKFDSEEFSQMFEEVLNTIDFIFRDGIDWKAFLQTLRTTQAKYADADLKVQAIEEKSSKSMVVHLSTSLDADKEAIHRTLNQDYLQNLVVGQQHKMLTKVKNQNLVQRDEIIKQKQQENTNLMEILRLLARQPITVNVQATASSKAIEGDDQSRSISVGENVEGTIVVGDHNQIQPNSAPDTDAS
ncbi:pentapeptide repeat-containing protein [cf. Phormidesmis sp. LEGE 11477]|uniref:pentapeptide repeat-containing protein n=1 Tax=cf. Phormidesmis sp. LEGE 11477 TaxID=1828680 RepID=UPI00187F94E3|nr:pentapeptide repeat-containing protein [cf. Phormidesmis sp. LEGE 11477]MBE9061758.1 pentapeptide repeat-containing protein [cf. Phormidesmis sp. LEGE 11477]